MKTGTILDMDMASLGQQLQRWGRWWVDEMAGMMPTAFQRKAPPLAGAIVSIDSKNDFSIDGEPLAGNAKRRRPATILLDEQRVLTRDIALPSLRRTELRKLVTLDLDRLMPFSSEQAYADVSAHGDAGEGGKSMTRIAVIQKADLRAIHDAALAEGLAPRAIGIASTGGKSLEFDFLPALIEESGSGVRSGARNWWVLVALLFVVNVGVMVWKDMHRVSGLQSLVDTQQPLVNASRKVAARLNDEDRLRRELFDARRKGNPLAALAFVTRTMPPGAWVQRYSWNSQALRISGYKSAEADVLGALRKSGAFASVRSSTSDVATEAAAGQPFDVTAEWRPK